MPSRGFRISDFMQQSDTIFGCQRAFQIYFLTRARFQIKISPFDRSPDQSFFLNHVFVRFLIQSNSLIRLIRTDSGGAGPENRNDARATVLLL